MMTNRLPKYVAWSVLLLIVIVTICPIGFRPQTLTTVGLDRAAAFALMMGGTPRIWLGGIIAYGISQTLNVTLFAALNILDGTVIGRNMQRHRHKEFIRFLNEVNRPLPSRREVHAIVDNYATHKHPKVRAWLARHPNWTFHFTPTSSSWLNAVEGFFATLTRRRLKRGVFHSLADLQAAINRFVAEHNQNPAPFNWKAKPDDIIAAAKREHQTLESIL